MRRETPIPLQVYRHIFPQPRKNVDPSSWGSYVRNSLIPEIRTDVQMYFGEIDSLEAKFPGMNYSRSSPHRIRLRRFPHHRRLFEAFDELNLSETEIYHLCDWEGTLFVQRKFEKENNTRIQDSSYNDIPIWREPSVVARQGELAYNHATVEEGKAEEYDEGDTGEGEYDEDADADEDEDEEEDGEEQEQQLPNNSASRDAAQQTLAQLRMDGAIGRPTHVMSRVATIGMNSARQATAGA